MEVVEGMGQGEGAVDRTAWLGSEGKDGEECDAGSGNSGESEAG